MPFSWNLFLTGGAGPQNPLAFAMQPQSQTEWCWSANAVSVNQYFESASHWQQCTLANAALKQTTCCVDGATANCNQQWYLDQALQIVDNFDQIQNRRGTLHEV